MTAHDRACALIERNLHMTIATADADGTPWVSPVFYVYDDRYDLYWVSDKTARHSENVRNRPAIAIVIFETGPPVDAVHLSADAAELNDDDVPRGIEIIARRKQPEKWTIRSSADVSGDGPWRIYRASIKSIEARAEKEVDGRAVVYREDADFR